VAAVAVLVDPRAQNLHCGRPLAFFFQFRCRRGCSSGAAFSVALD
jgi:hypothetical protein